MENIEYKNTNDNNRQYNLDLLKAFAIVFMVICHVVLLLGEHNEGHENNFWFTFADLILGEYFVAAHGFMFAMGVGIVYSKSNTPRKLIQRGVKIYFLAYIFNFLRYGVYLLGYDLINGKISNESLFYLLSQDIFQFAGLALIFTGFLKAIKLKETHIFLIAFLISILTTFIPNLDMKNKVLNTLIGSLIYTTIDETHFTFCNWYIFVAAGIVFGASLKKIEDKLILYKNVLKFSFLIMLVYTLLTLKYGITFLSRDNNYYVVSPLEALGFLSIDFFLLSLFYFMLKKFGDSKFRVFINMSKNLTKIYIIHWCILGFIETIFFRNMGFKFNYLQIYIFSVILLFVSSYLATKIRFKI